MDPLTSIAASGLRARMESLDLLANNLANAGTRGYKADREFYGLYVGAEASAGGQSAATSPVIERSWIDHSAGTVQVTNNQLDVALGEKTFLAVDGPSGVLYTRNGALRLLASGRLATSVGKTVRDVDGKPITLDPSRPVEILKDGSVMQEGQRIAQMDVVRFDDLSVLAKEGSSYFRNTNPNQKPVRAVDADVQQGKIEASNVGTAESAMRLVSIMRQFEMLEKALSLGGDMNRKAVEEVARPNS